MRTTDKESPMCRRTRAPDTRHESSDIQLNTEHNRRTVRRRTRKTLTLIPAGEIWQQFRRRLPGNVLPGNQRLNLYPPPTPPTQPGRRPAGQSPEMAADGTLRSQPRRNFHPRWCRAPLPPPNPLVNPTKAPRHTALANSTVNAQGAISSGDDARATRHTARAATRAVSKNYNSVFDTLQRLHMLEVIFDDISNSFRIETVCCCSGPFCTVQVTSRRHCSTRRR